MSDAEGSRAAHQGWLQDGHCHYVHWTKAWCNDDEGHEGPHWAVLLTPDGGMEKQVLTVDTPLHKRKA